MLDAWVDYDARWSDSDARWQPGLGGPGITASTRAATASLALLPATALTCGTGTASTAPGTFAAQPAAAKAATSARAGAAGIGLDVLAATGPVSCAASAGTADIPATLLPATASTGNTTLVQADPARGSLAVLPATATAATSMPAGAAVLSLLTQAVSTATGRYAVCRFPSPGSGGKDFPSPTAIGLLFPSPVGMEKRLKLPLMSAASFAASLATGARFKARGRIEQTEETP